MANKKIKVLSMGATVIDKDSVGIGLDVDGCKNPEVIATVFNAICGEGKQVSIGHLIAAVIAIWRANNE